MTLQGGQRLVVRGGPGSLHLTRWRLDLEPMAVRGPAGPGRWQGGTARHHAAGPEHRPARRLALAGRRFRLSIQGRRRAVISTDSARTCSSTRRRRSVSPAPCWTSPGAPRAGHVPSRRRRRLAMGAGGPLSQAHAARSRSPPARVARSGWHVDVARTAGAAGRLQGAGRSRSADQRIANFRAWLPRIGLELTSSGTVTCRPQTRRKARCRYSRSAANGRACAGRWRATQSPSSQVRRASTSSTARCPTDSRHVPGGGAAIPAVSFDAGGDDRRGGLVLDRFDGYALSGRIQGSGELGWTGAQPWRFEIDARSLRSANCGRASRDASMRRAPSRAPGFSATAPWTARLTSLWGTLFGRPLTGRGEIAHRDGEYRVAQRAARQRQLACGRRGSHRRRSHWTCRWDVDLRSLAIVAAGHARRTRFAGHGARHAAKPAKCAARRSCGDSPTARSRWHAASAEVDIDASDRRARTSQLDAERHRCGRNRLRHGPGIARRAALAITRSSSHSPRRATRNAGSPSSAARCAAEGAFDLGRTVLVRQPDDVPTSCSRTVQRD